MSDSPWSYTFCDMRTGEELAVLPLTKVKFTRALGGVGTLGGYLHLADERVRALNPWRATRQRRTKVYVEYDGRTVWGGPVITRTRANDSEGMTISAVTFEGWLHRQYLLTDLDIFKVPLPVAVQQLVSRAQILGSVDLVVDLSDDAPTQVSPLYLAREVKPILELLEGLSADEGVPFEFRVDVYRDPTTRAFRQAVRVGVPRLGRYYEDAPTTFAYPGGGLERWTLTEDGSAASNVMPLLGSGSGAAQPFEVLYDVDAGLDELDSGFPSWMTDYRGQDTDDMDRLWGRAAESMRAGTAAEYVLSGVRLRPQSYLGLVDPGDDIALEITHRTLEEWPAAVTYVTRVLADEVTVGDGGKADAVSVTIGGSAYGDTGGGDLFE